MKMDKKIPFFLLFLLLALVAAGVALHTLPGEAARAPQAGVPAVSERIAGEVPAGGGTISEGAISGGAISGGAISEGAISEGAMSEGAMSGPVDGERAPSQRAAAAVQDGESWMRTIPYELDSRAATTAENGYRVHIPDAAWLRLSFGDSYLAPGSYLVVTSALDGAQQRIDSAVMQRAEGRSAYFNGDTVSLALHMGASGEHSYFAVESVLAGSALGSTEPVPPTSLCGSDNRALSSATRVGRLTFVNGAGNPTSGCTAWLTSNGAVLTAGHCVDFDPDGFGSNLPDGVLDIDGNDLVEFDVPASSNTGALAFADPADQYSPILTSFSWDYDGEGQGLGKDWAVFRIEPNDTTGNRAHVTRGFFRMTASNPSTSSSVIRITGYGTDSTPDWTRNQVQQTHTGSYEGESTSGADVWHRYKVDTTGGNSGSPIIWDSHPTANYAVGIHTNAGCQSDGSGANAGTSFSNTPLENALQNLRSSNSVYVDRFHPAASTGDGEIFTPYDTVFEGEAAMVGSGRLNIVRGSYNETGLLDKPMLIDAPVGSVIIGQ